jgi:hypothetical protein
MNRSLQCPTGEEWDRYIAGAPGERQSWLAEHLRTCPFCRFAVAERRRELAEIGPILDRPELLLHLFPFPIEPIAGISIPRLAAQGSESVPPPESFTLASADRRLLLRAVRDPRSGEIWLYLLSDDPSLCRNVLVRPFGAEREYVTDNLGRVNLGNLNWPVPEHQTVEVRLPTAMFVLHPYEAGSEASAGTILSSPQGDQIRVTISGQGAGRQINIELLSIGSQTSDAPLRVAVRDVASGQIKMVRAASTGRAVVGDFAVPETIEIFLFQ